MASPNPNPTPPHGTFSKTPSQASLTSSRMSSSMLYSHQNSVSGPDRLQCMCVPDLLQRLCKIRRHEICIDDDDFAVVLPTDGRVWARLFTEYILTGARCSTRHCVYRSDDMLWYVLRGVFTANMMQSGGASPLSSSPSSRKSSSAQVTRFPWLILPALGIQLLMKGCMLILINWQK